MPAVTVRTSGPALLVVLEHEAPPRLALVAEGAEDADAFAAWLSTVPTLCRTILAAIADVDARGGLERSEAWHEALDGDSRSAD